MYLTYNLKPNPGQYTHSTQCYYKKFTPYPRNLEKFKNKINSHQICNTIYSFCCN